MCNVDARSPFSFPQMTRRWDRSRGVERRINPTNTYMHRIKLSWIRMAHRHRRQKNNQGTIHYSNQIKARVRSLLTTQKKDQSARERLYRRARSPRGRSRRWWGRRRRRRNGTNGTAGSRCRSGSGGERQAH